MALTKFVYTDNVSIIGAENLNDIQDAIIGFERVFELTELSVAAMPSEEVAANPHTVVKYNNRYYRLGAAGYKPGEGTTGVDVERYYYYSVDEGTNYGLKLDYFNGTANQVTA